MFIRIDQALPDPLCRQIRDEIVRGIAQGELAPGDALPSVRNLASDLGINLHTVNKAYALLRDEGFVLMRGRQGAYVAQPREPSRTIRSLARFAAWRWRSRRPAVAGNRSSSW